MTDILKKKTFFFLVKRAGRHFGFFKKAGRHEKGAGRRALQKKPRQNTGQCTSLMYIILVGSVSCPNCIETESQKFGPFHFAASEII